jgi:hypothetical protein
VAGELVNPALLAIDDADGGSALKARFAQRNDRRQRRSTGGHDVLDQADPLTGLVDAFEPVSGPVTLRLLPDDQKRQA